jgi:hypothetical protein
MTSRSLLVLVFLLGLPAALRAQKQEDIFSLKGPDGTPTRKISRPMKGGSVPLSQPGKITA